MEDLLAAAEADPGGDDSMSEPDEIEDPSDDEDEEDPFNNLRMQSPSVLSSFPKLGGGAGAAELDNSAVPAMDTHVVDSQVDDKALVAHVTEFFPQDSKLVYKIESNNTLAHFDKRASTVCRKFEDFAWLHERLEENANLAGVLIPFLPPKVTWVDVEESQTSQKVIQQDSRFLKYVCRHTKLREDIHVVVFLEPVSTASWFDRFSAPKIAVLPTDDQAGELCTAFAWAASYKNTLGPVISAADELAYFWRLLAVRERELAMDLHHFREIPGA
eukprot:gene554-23493_t